MVITYFGKQFLKITLGDLTIAYNPQDKSFKSSRFGADIAILATHHPFSNGVETVTLGDKEPFLIDGAGEYETKGIDIVGVGMETVIDGAPYVNTVYRFEVDGIMIVCMGHVGEASELSPKVKELAEAADIIFVPAGDMGTLSASASYKFAASCTPSIIIPLLYTPESLARFLKEGGQEDAERVDKLTLKRKDLDGKESKIIVLDPQ
jgi:hypothetical protein